MPSARNFAPRVGVRIFKLGVYIFVALRYYVMVMVLCNGCIVYCAIIPLLTIIKHPVFASHAKNNA